LLAFGTLILIDPQGNLVKGDEAESPTSSE
jgi:hypothetical protein